MAEVISIKIEYTGLSGQAVVKDLAEIAAWAKQLNSTVIKPRIDTSQIDALTKSQARALEITAKEAKAQAELARARASETRAEADLIRAKNQLAIADKQLAIETRKQETEEKKRKTAIKQTELAMQQAEVTAKKVTLAEKNRKLVVDKGNTALKQKQLQEEKTKTAVENHATAEKKLATQQEKTATTNARLAVEKERTRQAEERTAQAKERTTQATIRQTNAQRQNNEAVRDGVAPANQLGTSMAGLVTRFISLHMVIYKVISAFRDALNTMKEVDSALVSIQKTTGFSEERLNRLTKAAYEMASAYGRTATEILDAATVFARAGFKENLNEMTELSTLLQNVGDLEGDVSAKFIIATNAAWQLNGSYDALAAVIDGLNAQTNEAAVDMEALTSGITVAGSVFSNAGESVQTFAGLLGAGVAATQRSGSEVARGLRTIAMNIRQIKGELDDGEIIDAASISNAAKALDSVGIAVADANGELRLTSDVLNELAARWGILTTAEQSYLAQSLAGKRQANVLISLMQNWEEAQRQMALYANGAGSAMRENEIYLNSWEAKTKQLSAAWTKFVSGLVETKTIKRALDSLIKIVEFLDTKVGRFIVTIGGVSAAILVVIGVVSKLKVAFAALNAVLAANPLLLIAGIAAATIYSVINALNDMVTTAEEYAATAHEAYETYISMREEIDRLRNSTEALTEQEKTRLRILEAEAELKRQEAVRNAKLALSGKYGEYGKEYALESDEYKALQRELETVPLGQQDAVLEKMADVINAYSGIPQLAGHLETELYNVNEAMINAASLEEYDALAERQRALKTQIVEMAKELSEYAEIMGEDTPKELESTLRFLDHVIDMFDGVRDSEEGASESTQQWISKEEKLAQLLKEVEEKGIDITKTVFGNINTNERQLLEWTTENLKKYKDELDSWGITASDVAGEISTVLGMSSEYDGVEIAFSPILQTESGPVLLSADTVDKYIFGLIKEAGEGWKSEDLFSLDWRGLEIDGKRISGLLADIGDTAIKTGEAMHYVGRTGALALAGFNGYADSLVDRLKRVQKATDAMDSAIANVTDAINKYGKSSYEVYKAMENLEHIIPGATDGMYDLSTATWEVDAAQFASKNSLLDFIDAANSTKLTSLINELEKASNAALNLAGSIAMAMPGGYNDQFLEAYKAENNPALQKLKQQKADWDSYVKGLRERSDYKTTTTTKTQTTTSSETDKELEKLKNIVALRKQELEFLKESGASDDEIIAKHKEIQTALHNEAEHLRKTQAYLDGDEKALAEVKALSTEWWKVQKEITSIEEKQLQLEEERLKVAQELFDTIKKTVDEYLDKELSDKEKELQLEEKILAVQQAQAALANAQKERTVRYFNAASGQWEWGANQKNVQAAQDALKKAQDDLNKYQKEQAWKEFKDAWEYVSDQIKAGAITFQQAYNYMETKMKEIQNKYNVDMSGVLRDSIGGFQGVNKTIKDLDAETAAQLGASVGQIKAQNEALATATADAKTAVGEFKDAYDAVAAKVKSGEMSFDDAYAYLKEQAKTISDKYGTDMTGALDKAIEEMETIYTDLDSIKEAVKKGKITPDNAFEIISKALDSVSQKYGQDITGKVNKILDEKGGFKDGIGGLAQAVKDGKISIDDAFGYLEDATSTVADEYGINMTDELNSAIQKMGKSGEALDDLWKAIVLNKMRMNSVSWLELDEQKKKAQASGDTALAKAIGEQQDQLHAENEALGETIGATYDKSGHWSLNGSTLYDPAADRSSGEFSGGGSALSGGIRAAADGDIASLESAFGNMNGTEKHYLPGIGWKNVGQAVADLFNVQAGAKGNDIIRMLILRYGTPEEATEYLNTGIVPASFAESYNGALPELFYSVPATRRGIYDVWQGGFNENGVYNGTAMVYGGAAGDSVVPVNNGKIGVSGLENTGSNILLTPDGQILRVNPDGTVVATGGTWAGNVATDQPTLQLLDEVMQQMAQSGQYTDEEIYGKKYDSGGLLHGVGGIKATARDEMVLPPDITSRLLSPVSNSFVSGRMDDLRSMLGMRTQFGSVDNTRIGTQNNGDNYVMNGVTISEGQARTTTVYDLAQIARSLGAYQRS